MEDVLDATFYNDDFLTRTLTTSVLYDKSQLDLTFVENNNCLPSKRQQYESAVESPNLDFLKLGSPDLEQMFMNINENDSNFSSEDKSDASNAAFSLDDDLVSTENCFTDALQQLHDKQEVLPADFSGTNCNNRVGKENLHSKILQGKRKHISSPIHASPQKLRTQNPMKQLYHNPNQQRRNSFQQPQNKNLHRLNNLAVHHQNNISQPHLSISEQMALNNQITMMGHMGQTINAHHMQQQQHQQEIAFLTQAMGFQTDRESTLNYQNDRSMISNGFQSQHNVSSQVPAQVQQKMLEHQLMQQQIGAGFSNNNNNNTTQHLQQTDINVMGIDEGTLKMLMENPHMVPVNLELQELIKRERKKLRNRVASSKCRKRKLEREGRLEDKVKDLKEKNIELNAVANALKQQICDLKQRVMDHVGDGCQIVLPP